MVDEPGSARRDVELAELKNFDALDRAAWAFRRSSGPSALQLEAERHPPPVVVEAALVSCHADVVSAVSAWKATQLGVIGRPTTLTSSSSRMNRIASPDDVAVVVAGNDLFGLAARPVRERVHARSRSGA